MSHFFRQIDNDIVNFFVQKSEDSCYCRDQFLKYVPYLLCDEELDSHFGNIPEKTSDSFVVAESSSIERYCIGGSTM